MTRRSEADEAAPELLAVIQFCRNKKMFDLCDMAMTALGPLSISKDQPAADRHILDPRLCKTAFHTGFTTASLLKNLCKRQFHTAYISFMMQCCCLYQWAQGRFLSFCRECVFSFFVSLQLSPEVVQGRSGSGHRGAPAQ